MPHSKSFTKVFPILKKHGFLMLSDANVPSIASLIVGAPVKGSWWGHPAGNEIFNCSGDIDDHEDVISLKLINGKVTFVHRALWSALFGIVSRQHAWQTESLTADAKNILKKVTSSGSVQTRDISDLETKVRSKAIGDLEKYLLVHSSQVHTETGRHERVLRSWKSVISEKFSGEKTKNYEDAVTFLEKKVSATTDSKVKFPWN